MFKATCATFGAAIALTLGAAATQPAAAQGVGISVYGTYGYGDPPGYEHREIAHERRDMRRAEREIARDRRDLAYDHAALAQDMAFGNWRGARHDVEDMRQDRHALAERRYDVYRDRQARDYGRPDWDGR